MSKYTYHKQFKIITLLKLVTYLIEISKLE